MKKWIYTLFILASSSLAMGQCCRCGSSVFIDGVKMRPIISSEMIEIKADNLTKSNKGEPTTGYEGHNFIEDPAIIYPNPVKDIMHIKSTDPVTVIEILNITGEVVMDKMMGIDGQYDITDLPVGQYFVRIYFENRNDVQIEKLLIVK